MAEPTGNVSTPEDRWILLAPGTARLPERLLLAHCQGKVLFITGAGISRPSGLPDFRGLVLDIYKEVDPETHAVMSALPAEACNRGSPPTDTLSAEKRAEVNLFLRREYDVVLGMLERRIDPCMSEVFGWDDIPAAHTKMWENQHKPGNMAVLVQAKRPGCRTLEDVVEG